MREGTTLVNVSLATRERIKELAKINRSNGIKPDTIGGIVDNLIEAEYGRIIQK